MQALNTSKNKFQIGPLNKPLRRPGIYLIQNLINGKCYVGMSKNVANRLKDHAGGHGCSPVLMKAIKKYGAESFSATPVYYSLDGTDYLLEVETALIAEHNCIAHGYNVQAASQSYGPYGPAFADAVRTAHARPETREKLRKLAAVREANPEYVARRAEMLRTLRSDPELVNRHLENLRAAAKLPSRSASTSRANKIRFAAPGSTDQAKMFEGWKKFRNAPGYQEWASEQGKLRMSDPERKQLMMDKMKATMATEEFKARRSSASKAMHTPEVLAKKSKSMSAAWSAPGFKERMSEAMSGYKWITDGAANKKLREGAEIPCGWRLGKINRLRSPDPV